MNAPTVATKDYCNVLAREHGLDPAGYAGHFDDAVLVETPLPWKRDLYQQAGSMPQEVIDLVALWLDRYEAGQPYNHRPLVIAPDPAYALEGHRRVIYYSRRDGPVARFDKVEYLVPEPDAGPLVWALFEARDALSRFEGYRQPTTIPTGEVVRDILVCTHGTVEIACAKFGFPLYRHLRNAHAAEHLRVWRVSHFGGHVFAPTVMDMPTGHYWAYVGSRQADQIVQRTGDVADLHGHYRGWAGVAPGFAQAAERAIWQREGWGWLDTPKACQVVAADVGTDDPRWMEVRVDFTRPDGASGSYEARVEVTKTIETIATTDNSESHAYPQYEVTRLTDVSLHHE